MTVAGGSGIVGFSNPGWWGVNVKAQPYTGSFYVRGEYTGNFTVSFRTASSGDVLGSVEVVSVSKASEWTQHNFTFTPARAGRDVKNNLTITFDASVCIRVLVGVESLRLIIFNCRIHVN